MACLMRSNKRRGAHIAQDPEKLKVLFGEHSNLSYAAADVEDPDALKEALRGCRGVIFAAAGKGYWSAAKVDYQVRGSFRVLCAAGKGTRALSEIWVQPSWVAHVNTTAKQQR